MTSEPRSGKQERFLILGTSALAAFALAAPARGADTHQGARLYSTYCASCHGADGRGALPGTPDLARGLALLKPDAQIAERIRAGRGAMPAFFGILRERELFDLIAYLRTLK